MILDSCCRSSHLFSFSLCAPLNKTSSSFFSFFFFFSKRVTNWPLFPVTVPFHFHSGRVLPYDLFYNLQCHVTRVKGRCPITAEIMSTFFVSEWLSYLETITIPTWRPLLLRWVRTHPAWCHRWKYAQAAPVHCLYLSLLLLCQLLCCDLELFMAHILLQCPCAAWALVIGNRSDLYLVSAKSISADSHIVAWNWLVAPSSTEYTELPVC